MEMYTELAKRLYKNSAPFKVKHYANGNIYKVVCVALDVPGGGLKVGYHNNRGIWYFQDLLRFCGVVEVDGKTVPRFEIVDD